ncbi:hypothetical protein EJ05DRAFT_496964 [Pseudovirgaria hyperparasitica]|uniref:Nucleotidyl transferase AbiEii/AbiGii toxin family protein n=1 Tax=Pseudovirgaria hyperparasitica TaxID=470096 RepID=A0A6A6WGW0_9PEZI|nr:uncharacterized protein EJ05DRAFT_496964 [Pseudovirgaria hyperparasitica]KAF2762092.1 hypothetical protein EJ05DRAFT_496964 [Pseudovirgaria hyperparasitica]
MAEIYDTDRFAQLYYAEGLTLDNLALAARFLNTLFFMGDIESAFVGGWALLLRGNTRQTRDIDIAVGTDMPTLKAYLVQQARVCFPQTHGESTVTIFVQTGKSFDADYPDVVDYPVYVDIIISGYLNTPRPLHEGTEFIFPETENIQGTGPFQVLNLFNQMKAKLSAFRTRGKLSKNDFIDLIFLVFRYYDDIPTFKHSLNSEEIAMFVEEYQEVYGQDEESVAWVKEVLQ